ncbi:hypothetical protein D3OALGA1CA_5754 [Olavius algarvensis associated proteobacterium Delta 3]|nr:hypothetical protein D3OALGB2SA_2419 [Olavius algarvensis associated proteobacterium Delta 3]CAB5171297.1 hypothetical protein D3OALGA1CA_5754 [Olavius algarvensis associated proteobacterium Delta 3]
MLLLLFAVCIIIFIAVVLAFLYSTSEMPDIPDWEELGLDNDELKNNT